jgi:hypothetical protein
LALPDGLRLQTNASLRRAADQTDAHADPSETEDREIPYNMLKRRPQIDKTISFIVVSQ